MSQMLLTILLFFLGASFGSFLNVLITRTIDGEQWKTGRSHCDHCGRPLEWYDMVPIVSYMIYRGKSRCCHKMLSIQHPTVELMIGALFVWWFYVGSFFFRLVVHPFSTLQPLFWLVIGIILLAIFITDLFYGLIPSLFVYSGVGIVFLYRIALAMAHVYQWHDLWLALVSAAGAVGFFAFLRYVTHGMGMGDGDVELAAFVGILLGWPKVAVGVLSSFVIGALVSLVLMAFRKKQLGSTIPFGPFMIVGVTLALMWSDQILRLLRIY